MNIWQWVLVIIPFVRFGASLNETYKSSDKRERKLGRGLGSLAFLIGAMFVLYKAGVLKIL